MHEPKQLTTHPLARLVAKYFYAFTWIVYVLTAKNVASNIKLDEASVLLTLSLVKYELYSYMRSRSESKYCAYPSKTG